MDHTQCHDVDSSLDPTDWTHFRAQGHRMLDDMIDYTQTICERPVWQPRRPPSADS